MTVMAVFSLSASCFAAETDSNEPTPASHVEIEPIGSTPETEFEKLASFCMGKDVFLGVGSGWSLRSRSSVSTGT